MEGFRMHPQPAHLSYVPYHHPHHPLHQPPLPSQHHPHHHHHLHNLPQQHLINYANPPLPPVPHTHTHPHHLLHHPPQTHHHLPQHAYLRPITPPPSPHDANYAASTASSASPSHSLNSSTSTAATSHWDHQSVSSATTSSCDDRARTPRPGAKSAPSSEVDGQLAHERFLLISTVPQDSTNNSLKAAFRPFGDLVGIYKLFLEDGIVILAFYDSRQCLAAHRYLNRHRTLPRVHRPSSLLASSSSSEVVAEAQISSQLLTAGQLATLIGDSPFIREAEGALIIQTEAFVNGVLLQRLLEHHGDICSFQSLDSNGMLYKCEFFDARRAHSAMNKINSSSSYPLGVPLKISLDQSSTQSTMVALPPQLVDVFHQASPDHHHHHHHAAYMFPPTPTTPAYPGLDGAMDEEEGEVEMILSGTGSHGRRTSSMSSSGVSISSGSTGGPETGLIALRARHDTIDLHDPPTFAAHQPHATAAAATTTSSTLKQAPATASRSRRSSTGTTVVPGETTPFALEKFRASLISAGGTKRSNNDQAHPLAHDQTVDMPSQSSEVDPSALPAMDGLGLGLKIKETGAGLMLMDDCEGRTSSGMEVSTGGMERGRTTSRGLSNTLILARTNAQPTQRLKPSRIALPPFMGPLPLPSPLPSGSLWSASSETPTDEDGHTSAGNTTPFRFGSGKDVRSGGGHVIYNSVGTPSEGSPTANRHPRPLRLYNTNVGPRLRSTRLHTQLASPSSPSTPSSEATVVNLNSGGGGFPPLYAPANRPLLPLSARTSLSQTRDPPSPRNTVDIDKIANGMDTRTTIMIKNVPSRMTLTDMEAFINKICEREYDFLYLRMDFVTGNNVGYAFVNFIEVSSLLKFLQTYLGKRWNLYSSDKVMYAAYATYQGKAALVTKFQNSSILDREEKVKPHIYYSSGEKKGLPEPFPPPNDSARKARSLAAASEHGLFSRMEYNRRQQLSQHHSSSAADQSASTKLFASSPFATRSPVSSRKEHLTSAAQSGDTSEYYTASSDPRSSSSYTSPRGFASPHHVSPSTPAFKANTSFGPGRYSARRSSEGPHTAMLGRRASATLIQSP